jgi:hypothetical protein
MISCLCQVKHTVWVGVKKATLIFTTYGELVGRIPTKFSLRVISYDRKHIWCGYESGEIDIWYMTDEV